MKNQIIKREDLSVIGEDLVGFLRENWGMKEIEVEGYEMDDDGGVRIVRVKKERMNYNVEKNLGVERRDIYRAMNLIRNDSDKIRVMELIKKEDFEVRKMIQVFEVIPEILTNPEIRPGTWEEAGKLNSPSFATMIKYKGKVESINVVRLMLKEFVGKFGKRNDLDDKGILMLAVEVLDEFRRLSVGELKMILNIVLKGKSGGVFNVDHQRIMNWISEAWEDRLKYYERKSFDDHLREMGEEKQHRPKFYLNQTDFFKK
jgi:hypothetical protein